MEQVQAWSPAASKAKIDAARGGIVNVLDALTPMCAPFAARWDTEADRRKALRTPDNLKALMKAQREHNAARSTAAQAKNQRTAARTASSNPLSTTRRAARTADKAARGHKREAASELKTAKANYPATLRARAIQAHTAHTAPTALVSWAMGTPWPATVSAGLIVLNGAALWLGRRQPRVHVEDGLTAEERQLAGRLDPTFWVQHASERGLDGTVTTPAALTSAGLECEVRLDGKWTTSDLRRAEANIRALLRARTDLPIVIKDGTRGGWAVLVLRTRSATDGVDLAWKPGASWAVDTVTGEEVNVPLGQRMLIAGRSGSGKSWSARPLLFDASEGDTNALAIIDLKQVEARCWDHRARVATTPEAVEQLVAELVAEQAERLAMVPKGEDTITPTKDRPRITLFVDEGAEVMTVVKDALAGLESIARMGRAACIDLWWATQKPTMSGSSAGIPPQIAPQLSTRICLAVSSPTEARTVLGEDAQAKGWTADELPAPGYALVRDGKRKPNAVKTRALSPKQVVALPERPIWERPGVRPVVSMRKPPEPPAPAVQDSTDDRVLRVVVNGAARQKDIAERSGLPKGTVSKVVSRLVDSGRLARLEDGTVAAL
ncbi:DUF7343 domain-containing protein [Streptomyces sp. NPDC003343]